MTGCARPVRDRSAEVSWRYGGRSCGIGHWHAPRANRYAVTRRRLIWVDMHCGCTPRSRRPAYCGSPRSPFQFDRRRVTNRFVASYRSEWPSCSDLARRSSSIEDISGRDPARCLFGTAQAG
jgi:hypothetical protein